MGLRVEVVPNPDPLLVASGEAVASSDSVVLDGCGPWFNLAREVIGATVEGAFLVDLGDSP